MQLDAMERARQLAEAALERKAKRVVALDVRGLTSFAEAFLVMSGSSDRHVQSVADRVLEAAQRAGDRPLGVEGYDEGRWVLIDLNDVVVHVFQEETREIYDLERLWADAAVVELGSGDREVLEQGGGR